MNEASKRYNTKVEIPISVVLETIFTDDNEDVESLCRWALHYGFIDLVKENENDRGYYKLQDDYTKQSFYIWLNKEERKQYDYENHLIDKLEEKDKEIERLNNIINKTKENINDDINLLKTGVKGNTKHITVSEAISILKIILIQMD